MRLQTCVGSVCVGDTTLMYRGWECARLGSSTRHVSFYASLVGGGLRLSRPSSGRNGSVRVYRRVIFGKQNWVGWTSIGALSELWVGGRRGPDSGSDLGEYLRTTGPGPRTILDLTHVRNSFDNKTNNNNLPQGTTVDVL
jgi:hypothetical protein